MADFDDLRGLTEDDDEEEAFGADFSFDDLSSDGEIDFSYGEEIYEEENLAPEKPGPVNQLLNTMTAQERMLLTIMLFGNVLVLGIAMLLVTGRIG